MWSTLLSWAQLLFTAVILLGEYLCRSLIILFRCTPTRSVVRYFREFPLVSALIGSTRHFKSALELIESSGYSCQRHYAKTEDGWYLCLHHICPNSAEGVSNAKKPVVLIMHGFMQSSEAWLVRGDPSHSLPFILSSKGFDVWLGNNRGNTYSHKNQFYKPYETKYWDFSIDELASIDLPAMIHYVLKYTGAEKLSYIGFSQGSAQAFASFSLNRDLAKKISLFVALAPTTKVRGISHRFLKTLINVKPEIFFTLFGRKALISSFFFWRGVLSERCFVWLIDKLNYLIFGWTMKRLCHEEKAILYNHLYSYTSVKVAVHWFQIQQANQFQMYDDAQRRRNRSDYQAYFIPVYDLRLIECPVALFYGGSDTLPNFNSLLDELVPIYINKVSEYEHLCFMWGKQSHETIFVDIVDLLKKYNSPSPPPAATPDGKT
ncbi:uncharacterized protein LOC126318250 [Schistocerca gregaria]|uniref:uncharacterized protein LOC126318250 n=1 Tax=Schistocerca gregaria TaxID=7010 RepID=UPI00211DD000|nr:uncharacterized protein LOC126318250 [Schistocerca gregaria]